MDEQKLQGIKNDVDQAKLEVGSKEYPSLSWCAWVVENVPLLITAYEQAQAELAEAKVEHDKMLYLVNQEQCENERLRKQLAEAQTLLESTTTMLQSLIDKGIELAKAQDKEIKASQAEVERQEKDIAELEDAIRKNAKLTGLLI